MQLIFEKINAPNVIEVQELINNARGSGGFGSTGVMQNDDTNGKTNY